MNDTLRYGKELADAMTEEQGRVVEEACERVRMGKSGYWHELAELVMQRDAALELIDGIDDAFHTMKPRHCPHPTMDGVYPCWIVWLPKEGTCKRKTLKEAILEFAEQTKPQ